MLQAAIFQYLGSIRTGLLSEDESHRVQFLTEAVVTFESIASVVAKDFAEIVRQLGDQQPSEQTREMIRQRGEELGFRFRMDRLKRIYNTFDTHRILHWAGLEGRQQDVKHALFEAYFGAGDNPGDHDVLVRTEVLRFGSVIGYGETKVTFVDSGKLVAHSTCEFVF